MDPTPILLAAPHLLERIWSFLEYPQVERCRLVSKTWQSAVDEYLGKFGQQLKLQHLMEVWSAKEPQMLEMKGFKSPKYLRILGLNSSGRDTILTVFADGNKSLFYFYKDNKLISVLDEIKTTSTKGELKIGKDFVIILPNDNSCNEQKKIYIVGRSTGQILHRKTVYGTVRTIYVPENSNELFVVSNPVYGQPEVHIHHYPDVALEECEVLELRIDTVIPLSFKTCSDYLVIYEIDSSVLIYGYREKRKVARLHYGPDMFVVHTRRNADFLVIQKRFYHNFDIVDLKSGQVLESLRINELCFVTLGHDFVAFPTLHFKSSERFTLWSRGFGVRVLERKNCRKAVAAAASADDDDDGGDNNDAMNELALENPSGLLRAKARVVGAMLLYKETDMHDEVDKYYLINTKRSKLPDGRKSLDEMIPIPAETGSRIWKCHGTNDELKLFYTESFDWANLRYQSPRSWWFVKLPLFRRLCWWRRAKIFKIKF